MPRNGSGTFVPAASTFSPAVAGTTLDPGAGGWATTLADLAAGLTQSLSKDGQTLMAGNLDYSGSFKNINMANGTAATDSATLGQVQAAGGSFVSAGGVTGTADAILLAPSPAISAYAAGQEFWFVAEGTNSVAVTVAVSGLAAKAIQANAAALVAGDIVNTRLVGIKYDGTVFQLIGSRAAVTHTADIAAGAATLAKLDTTGTAGQILTGVAAASAPIWATPLGLAAQNMLINGGMQINQRVVTTGAADDTYINDRFYILTQTNTITISQQALPVNGVQSAVRLTQAQAVAQRMGVAQIIEAVNCQNVRGQAVASNWWVTSSTSQTIRYAILEWTGAADAVTSDVVNDWTSSTYTAGNFFNATTLTVTQTGSLAVTAATPALLPAITGVCGSATNNLIVFVWTSATCAQNVTLDISMAQCAIGTSLNAFVWPQMPEVLAQCQRYYQKSFAPTTAPAQAINTNWTLHFAQMVAATTANNGGVLVMLPVEMRTSTGSYTLYNPAASNAQVRNVTTGTDCTLSNFNTTGPNKFSIIFTSPGGSAAGNDLSVNYSVDSEL